MRLGVFANLHETTFTQNLPATVLSKVRIHLEILTNLHEMSSKMGGSKYALYCVLFDKYSDHSGRR